MENLRIIWFKSVKIECLKSKFLMWVLLYILVFKTIYKTNYVTSTSCHHHDNNNVISHPFLLCQHQYLKRFLLPPNWRLPLLENHPLFVWWPQNVWFHPHLLIGSSVTSLAEFSPVGAMPVLLRVHTEKGSLYHPKCPGLPDVPGCGVISRNQFTYSRQLSSPIVMPRHELHIHLALVGQKVLFCVHRRLASVAWRQCYTPVVLGVPFLVAITSAQAWQNVLISLQAVTTLPPSYGANKCSCRDYFPLLVPVHIIRATLNFSFLSSNHNPSPSGIHKDLYWDPTTNSAREPIWFPALTFSHQKLPQEFYPHRCFSSSLYPFRCVPRTSVAHRLLKLYQRVERFKPERPSTASWRWRDDRGTSFPMPFRLRWLCEQCLLRWLSFQSLHFSLMSSPIGWTDFTPNPGFGSVWNFPSHSSINGLVCCIFRYLLLSPFTRPTQSWGVIYCQFKHLHCVVHLSLSPHQAYTACQELLYLRFHHHRGFFLFLTANDYRLNWGYSQIAVSTSFWLLYAE